MIEIFFTGHALWFTIPALIGTGIFLLRILLMMLGGAGLDIHHDVDIHPGDAHADPGDAFKLLSVQSVSAFLMGFGWGGIGGLKGSGFSELTSIALGVVAGGAMVWLVGMLLRAAWSLQSSGNVRIENTVGADGTVYVSIPEYGKGRGQVNVVVDDRQRTYDAISGGPALASQTRVKVIGVNDDNTLTVVPA